MNKLLLTGLTVSILLLQGCFASSPIMGALNVTTHSGTGSIGIVDNNIAKTKTGESLCHSILGLVAFGNCSAEEAQKRGGIDNVASVNHSTVNVLYFYSQYKTTVIGD